MRHYPLERFARTAREAVARLRDVPGVDNAAVLSFAPFTGERVGARVALLDGPVPGSTQATGARPVPDDQGIAAGDMQMVSPDRLWPGQTPIGKFVQASGTEYSSSEVVGVVPDVRYGGLAQDASETLYAPYAQGPMVGATLLVRTIVPDLTVVPRVRAALATLGADLVVGEIQTMDDLMEREAASRRFSAGVMTFFAASGLALAALGLAGTIAFLVRRRTAEIGIRMALGATPAGVIRMFVVEVLHLVGLGIVIGLLGAAAGSRLLTTLLFRRGRRGADCLYGRVRGAAPGGAGRRICPRAASRASESDRRVASGVKGCCCLSRPSVDNARLLRRGAVGQSGTMICRTKDPAAVSRYNPDVDHSLPGADLIERGLADLAVGAESIEALLVSIGSPRLNGLGITVESPLPDPERRLYARLAAENPDSAHSRYNALIRRLVSFERALECVTPRT